MFDGATVLEMALQMLSYAFDLVFVAWPILVLSPLQGRRPFLSKMLLAWGLVATMRVFLFFSSVPPLFRLIPEPLNTVLFFASGILLSGIKIGQNLWRRRTLHQVGDNADSAIDLLKLSPRQFEEMVVELYRASGHRAKRTGAVGDHGVDVVVQARNGERWVVQCKRWRGAVGEPIVRDFYGVIQHEKADKGAIITTGEFTQQAHEWARGKPIYLCNGSEFLKRWKAAKRYIQGGDPSAPEMAATSTVSEPENSHNKSDTVSIPLCPRCGVSMVLRTARRGQHKGEQFYGCPNYPECREITSLENISNAR